MKYILSILMISMFTLSYSQAYEKNLLKKSNKVTEAKDMLGYDIKVIKDKKGNKLYIEHTIGNTSRFVVYKNNKQVRHGVFYTEKTLASKD